MNLSEIDQAVYNSVRQEGPASVGPNQIINVLKRKFPESEILESIWRMISRQKLELTADRKLKVRDD